MLVGKHLSNKEKKQADSYFKEGKSIKEISTLINAQYHVVAAFRRELVERGINYKCPCGRSFGHKGGCIHRFKVYGHKKREKFQQIVTVFSDINNLSEEEFNKKIISQRIEEAAKQKAECLGISLNTFQTTWMKDKIWTPDQGFVERRFATM